MLRLLLTLLLIPQFLCASTPIADRLAVLENYYGANPDNPDRSVFAHYQTWHAEDVRVLDKLIVSHQNKAHLTNIYRAAVLSFVEEKISFPKLAVFYALYSLVMSHELEPQYADAVIAEHVTDWLNLVTHQADKLERVWQEGQNVHEIDYSFRDGEVLYPQTKLSLMDDLTHFLRLGRRNGHVRVLPFVSADGACTTRQVNQAFALGTPIMRVNLTKARDLDNVQLSPAEICSIDLGRAYLNHKIGENTEAFGYPGDHLPTVKRNHIEKYKSYRLWNARVKAITDPETQRLCDFMLNLLMLNTFIGASPQPLTIFEQYKSSIAKNIEKLVSPQTLDGDYWQHLESEDCRDQAQYYYDHVSAVRHFLSDDKTKLLTMTQLFNQYHLPRNKVLTLAVLQDKMGQFDQVNEDGGVDFDLRKNASGVYELVKLDFAWVLDGDYAGLRLRPQNDYSIHVEGPLIEPYNQILALVQGLSKAGHVLQMWTGDELNLAGVAELLDKAFNAFYTHVLAEDLSLTRAVKRVKR